MHAKPIVDILTNAVRGKQSNKSVKIFHTFALPYLYKKIDNDYVYKGKEKKQKL